MNLPPKTAVLIPLGESSMSGRTISHLLHLLDDNAGRKYVVIAATSHLQAINQQLRQSSRLDMEVTATMMFYCRLQIHMF
jgi:SpoVK/Ycf46/Vps4 family AAA+-type ATPase